MIIVYTKAFLRDVEKINRKNIADKLSKTIEAIKSAQDFTKIPQLKKLKGHKSAYRIKIASYRLGYFYIDNKVILVRFVDRKDIYKLFP
jgi:mRNA interferase RelE/StbE